MEYFANHELFNGEPSGVFVIDRVQDDELHPYSPEERMRKDGSAVAVITPHWTASPSNPDGEKELTVATSMGKFIKLHRSECPLATPAIVEEMRENVMIPTMRELLNQSQQ
ncbi:hypothetical protein Gpo141_00010998 [Globisporangium polare]